MGSIQSNNIVEDHKENHELEESNFDFVKRIKDNLFGEVRILKSPKTQQVFALKTMIANSLHQKDKIISKLEQRKEMNSDSVLKLLKYTVESKDEFCTRFYRIHIAYEYLEHTLEKEIKQKFFSKSNYSEEQIYSFVSGIVRTLLAFKSNDMFHGDIRPATVFIDYIGNYKMSDIQFLSGLNSYKQIILGYKESCYLSPEMFQKLCEKEELPEDFSFEKNDVFSLGMTVLEMAIMRPVHAFYDFKNFTIDPVFLNKQLEIVKSKYSNLFYTFVLEMLTFDPKYRPDFQALELAVKPECHFKNDKSGDHFSTLGTDDGGADYSRSSMTKINTRNNSTIGGAPIVNTLMQNLTINNNNNTNISGHNAKIQQENKENIMVDLSLKGCRSDNMLLASLLDEECKTLIKNLDSRVIEALNVSKQTQDQMEKSPFLRNKKELYKDQRQEFKEIQLNMANSLKRSVEIQKIKNYIVAHDYMENNTKKVEKDKKVVKKNRKSFDRRSIDSTSLEINGQRKSRVENEIKSRVSFISGNGDDYHRDEDFPSKRGKMIDYDTNRVFDMNSEKR